MATSTKIKKGDQVQVMAGKDKGKKGKVLRVDRAVGRVVVEHVNMIKRHSKPNPAKGVTGGIVEREAPVSIANVMVISPDSGRPSRVGFKRLEDGRRVRVAKVDGAILDQ
ncbi:MAG TPA: 50S ribosomal protein L24 [Thermoanaerobaculaceae bacterium]|nr:50S ribosomal protein L24 [Thermoanaerobaculaceae bacterium]HRS17348.1 50S ribosomal protein L24 [Thermoanaerobaculaceae bacterium]